MIKFLSKSFGLCKSYTIAKVLLNKTSSKLIFRTKEFLFVLIEKQQIRTNWYLFQKQKKNNSGGHLKKCKYGRFLFLKIKAYLGKYQGGVISG
jgi:hypothetical protein